MPKLEKKNCFSEVDVGDFTSLSSGAFEVSDNIFQTFHAHFDEFEVILYLK